MLQLYVSMLARTVLLAGGLNYLYIAYSSKSIVSNRYLFAAVGLAALYLVFDRDFYLPFLGKCAVPILEHGKTPMENAKSIEIKNLPPNVKVIYWAANANDSAFKNPMEAYGDYTNSGITRSDAEGNAILQVECPARYSVTKFGIMESQLPKHVHYRFETPDIPGLLSPVYTKSLEELCT